MNNKKKVFIATGIAVAIIVVLGITYAWLTQVLSSTKVNKIVVGGLSLVLDDEASNGINITNGLPQTDSQGLSGNAYTFSVENNGASNAKYNIYLEDEELESGQTRMSDSNIKYYLVKNNDESESEPKLLSTVVKNNKRVLDEDIIIEPRKTNNYSLKLWIDQESTQEEVGGKVFKSKIKLDAIQTEESNGPTGPTKIDAQQGETHKGIVYLDPTNLTATCNETLTNNNYTTNGNNGIPTGIKTGCMKWYIFDDSGDNYKMILDHNTTATQQWESTNSASSSTTSSYENSLVKVEINKLVSESRWKIQPRLITVEEINTITGRANFNLNEYTNNYCLDNPNTYTYAQMCSTITGGYSWLYNYTNSCTNYGCDVEDSSTNGYFTSDTLTYEQSWGYGHRVWSILYYDQLAYFDSLDNLGGIRPVITIPKSMID